MLNIFFASIVTQYPEKFVFDKDLNNLKTSLIQVMNGRFLLISRMVQMILNRYWSIGSWFLLFVGDNLASFY
jgi:hypothetical protein